ncbi:hypothetical protein, partial [Yersinia pestis]
EFLLKKWIGHDVVWRAALRGSLRVAPKTGGLEFAFGPGRSSLYLSQRPYRIINNINFVYESIYL